MDTAYDMCLSHARTDRAVRSLVALKLESYKLTMMEWLLLNAVVKGPSKGMSMTGAGDVLDVTLPQITALTNKLLDLKLIKQKTQSHDRRSRHIVSTIKGRQLADETSKVLSEAMTEWISSVPAEQYEAYLKTMRWLSDNRPHIIDGIAK